MAAAATTTRRDVVPADSSAQQQREVDDSIDPERQALSLLGWGRAWAGRRWGKGRGELIIFLGNAPHDKQHDGTHSLSQGPTGRLVFTQRRAEIAQIFLLCATAQEQKGRKEWKETSHINLRYTSRRVADFFMRLTWRGAPPCRSRTPCSCGGLAPRGPDPHSPPPLACPP